MEKLAEGVTLALEASTALSEGNAVGGAAGGGGGFGLWSFSSPVTFGKGSGEVSRGLDFDPVRRAHREILRARKTSEITGATE